MKKSDVIQQLLGEYFQQPPRNAVGEAFAPSNIALCKYWGKRNQELNLPVTSSLSISLGEKGATANLKILSSATDEIILNGSSVDPAHSFSKRLISFLNLFRQGAKPALQITIHSNIPIAAGLASSAAGFASIVKALDDLYGWQLPTQHLSILARLGSGSAARSLWQGFVEWHQGSREDGMDCYAEKLDAAWPEFCIGLLIMSDQAKSLSSREAMQRTVATSALYSAWPQKVSADLLTIRTAITEKDFTALAQAAESNALTMHATMLSAWPPVSYTLQQTISAMQKVWQLREQRLDVYFTQDAGPNLKLLFLKKNAAVIKEYFPEVEVLQPLL